MAKVTNFDFNSLTRTVIYTPEEVAEMKRTGYDVESVYYPIEDTFELVEVEAEVMTWAAADMIWILYDMGAGILYYMSENELRECTGTVKLKAVRLNEEEQREIEGEIGR